MLSIKLTRSQSNSLKTIWRHSSIWMMWIHRSATPLTTSTSSPKPLLKTRKKIPYISRQLVSKRRQQVSRIPSRFSLSTMQLTLKLPRKSMMGVYKLIISLKLLKLVNSIIVTSHQIRRWSLLMMEKVSKMRSSRARIFKSRGRILLVWTRLTFINHSRTLCKYL